MTKKFQPKYVNDINYGLSPLKVIMANLDTLHTETLNVVVKTIYFLNLKN